MSTIASAYPKLTVQDHNLVGKLRRWCFRLILFLLLPPFIGWIWQVISAAKPLKESWFVLAWGIAFFGLLWVIGRVIVAELTRELTIYLSRLRVYTQDVGHELSAPLSLLDYRLQALERDTAESGISNSQMESLQEPLKRMKTLVDDFRLLAKSERPVNPGGLAFVKVDNMVRSLGEQVKPLLAEKEAILDLTELDSVSIIAEQERMERVFLNLLHNAIRHIEKNGTIKVIVKVQDAASLEIRVKDNGCGIGPDLLPHIFERFIRKAQRHEGEEAKIISTRGSGLGLAIVKAIVESHGGTIAVDSQLGQGAEFIISWPRRPDSDRYTKQILTGQEIDD